GATARARGREGIGGTRRARPRAVLRHVAGTRRGATDRARGREGIGGTGRARPRAVLRHVARAGRGATDRARGREGIGGTRRARPRAVLRHVAGTRRGATDRARGLEGVGGTGRARSGAVLRRVALARRGAADGRRGLEGVGRAGGARARAGLVHVTVAGRRATHGPGVAGRVLAGVVRPVALVAAAGVAVVGARRPGRGLRVGRPRCLRAAVPLCRVALARRGAADGRRGLEGVGRAGGARARAGLVDVADPGRRAADGPGVAGRVLASVVRPVALVAAAGVAVVGARRPGRVLRVARAGGARSGAVLRRVALARRGAADGGRGLEGVGRAGGARARAGLVHVADPGRRATHGPGVDVRMAASGERAVALVAAAVVAVVGARRPGRVLRVARAGGTRAGAVLRRVALARRGAADGRRGLEGVGRAGGARARAGLVHVADPGRRATHGPGVAGRVLASVVRPVTRL